MTKIFNIIAIILIILSYWVYTLFKDTKNEIITTNHNTQITYVEDISKNLSNEILHYCKNNIYKDLQKNKKIRALINLNLQSFITTRYKYIYVIDRETNQSLEFRFLLDGAKNIENKSEFEEGYIPMDIDKYRDVYKYKKTQYFQHKNMKSVSITSLYPIIRDDKVEAILVIDFSIKEQEIIIQSLQNFNDIFEDILLLFILIFAIILWFSYIDNKREKENKKTHQQLIETSNELKNLNDTLELKIQDEIEKNYKKDQTMIQYSKQAQMGEMISMIAHQWRQPLNTISASAINLSLLDSMNILPEGKIQTDSKFIQNQCQKMSETINTFMNFAKPTTEMKEFKIVDSLDSIMLILQSQFKNHNITIKIDMQEDISITAYKDLLEQVIINILSNARDAFDEHTTDEKIIKIVVTKQNSIPIITIEDNAGGIPSKIQEKIFNPYFTTKEQGKGTGIGLYMSINIMKKSLQGDLQYIPIKNGSIFKLILGS